MGREKRRTWRSEKIGIGPAPPSPTRSPQLSRACRFLEGALADERVRPAAEVQAEARAAGISPRTLKRAKRHLGVVVGRRGWGPGSHVVWQLRVKRLPYEVVQGILKLDREAERKRRPAKGIPLVLAACWPGPKDASGT